MHNPSNSRSEIPDSLGNNYSSARLTAGMVFQLADGTIQACNAAAETILGFTLAQMQNSTSLDSLWQTIREDGMPFPGNAHPTMVALHTGQPVAGVVMGVYRPNGNLLWIKIDAQPLFTAHSPIPWAAVATFWDITVQKKVEVVDQPNLLPPSEAQLFTVLIVDDCAEDREMYRRYLQQNNDRTYRILAAETGAAGLEICRTTKLDLVLLDYCLPDYEGLEFVAALQAQSSSNYPPVIVVTGQGNEAIAVQILKAGVKDYLIKGQFSAHELQSTVDSSIDNAQLTAQIQRSAEKERLVTQIAQRIHRSLDLKDILHATVWEVRQFLQSDRVLIFCFEAGLDSGQVVVEAVEEPWQALLANSFRDPCFVQNYAQLYRQGRVTAISDIETADLEPCYREFLTHLQVRANLVVPILRDRTLWGLLIAQQCSTTRHWLANEIDLLQQLATQVGIALHRVELYLQAQAEIAERRYTERLLRESQERLQLGIQVAGVALAKFDYATNTVELSPEAAALYGLPANELVISRQRLHETFHPQERAELSLIIEQVLDPTGTGWFAREHRVVWQTGEVRWLYVRKQVFFERFGENLQPAYAILAAIDITERQLAEAAIEESERKFRGVFDQTFGLMALLDLDGKVLDINQAALDSIAAQPLDIVGKYFWETPWWSYSSDIQSQLRVSIAQAATGQTIRYEVQFYNAISAISTADFSLKPVFDENAQVAILIAEGRDITDRKQAEIEREYLLQQEQAARAGAEQANSIKDEFLAVLSHELRSPLNPILGWTNLLQHRNLDAKRTAAALATIERNAKLQAQLIDDLLDISRIMRGKLVLNAAPVNLTFAISAALETVRLAAETRNIHIHLALPEQPIQVFGDGGRLQQVFWNLLSNAVKFTSPGGQVCVHLTQVETNVQIQVTDTGKGIAPDFLPYVFEHFRQEDKATTRKFGGLGLGLAIARQIIEMHGGSIGVDSLGLDRGATFTVRLPLLRSDSPQIAAGETLTLPQFSAVPLANVRALVVDDDPDTCDFLTFMLQENGAFVTAAASATAALQVLAQSRFDILLSDIGMPEMDGHMLVREMRRRTSLPNYQIPAIALTAYAGESDRQQAIAAGFQCHIAKPVNADEVITLIIQLVQQSK